MLHRGLIFSGLLLPPGYRETNQNSQHSIFQIIQLTYVLGPFWIFLLFGKKCILKKCIRKNNPGGPPGILVDRGRPNISKMTRIHGRNGVYSSRSIDSIKNQSLM